MQGLVLSPTLFLDQLPKQLREECQTYVGAVIHADDLRTTAESKEAVSHQAREITNHGIYQRKPPRLMLNASKLEVL